MSVKWRVIELDEHDAYKNMSIDESILEHVHMGASYPTIRFYRWLPSAVSIGRFQGMNDEVNIERCRELGISHVRRMTGGGAVYHDHDGELTYSIIAKQDNFPSGIRDSYEMICGWIIDGLEGIGIDAKFAPINDIIVNGRKISGNAQTRKDGVLLQHGTILYKLDISKMFSVLNVSKEKISDKMIKSVEERVTSITAQKEIGFNDFYSSVLKGFVNGKDYQTGTLSKSELDRAEILKGTYSSQAWNFS
ncbi:MAG: lipoate--protein ligase family protein, partial [Candidatus Micrarchaeota archaeon]|nr:lipoate--protein ligase family protein [Candidatus Micrarchaeota archaeon]